MALVETPGRLHLAPHGFARLNSGLSSPGNKTMHALLGCPRGNYGHDPRGVTNPCLAKWMQVGDLGPFRCTGLAPAIEALRRIVDEIASDRPDILAVLGVKEMLCCRLVRGSNSIISNHSWGTAIDVTLAGSPDPYSSAKARRALGAMALIFNRHGFFWGVAFDTANATHFEVSEQLLRKWARAGLFGPVAADTGRTLICFGDRGPAVVEVQALLNRLFAADLGLAEDGLYGPATGGAVAELQRRLGRRADGSVNPGLLTRLRHLAP